MHVIFAWTNNIYSELCTRHHSVKQHYKIEELSVNHTIFLLRMTNLIHVCSHVCDIDK